MSKEEEDEEKEDFQLKVEVSDKRTILSEFRYSYSINK